MPLEEFLDFIYRLIWAVLLTPLVIAGILGLIFFKDWLDNPKNQMTFMLFFAGLLLVWMFGIIPGIPKLFDFINGVTLK